MALTIGGKRVTIPGGASPATPLSPLEQLLVDGLIIVNREIVDAINAESFADAIRDLDPDLFDRLLNEVFRWQDIQEVLDNALRGIVLDGSLAQARDIIRNTPRIQQSPFADLEFTGERLPNGILVPSGGPPDVEFAIATPVEQMFNYVSDSALNYARVRSAQLVRSIDESNRLAIRQLIAEAFTTPRSVDDTARLIRQIVGLHPRWARAVENFHDKNVQGLIADGLSEAKARARADELTKRYRDKLIRRRAEMIARTEIQQALNFGRQMSWVASDRAGLVDPRTMKEWRTAPLASRYGPPCPTCSAMRGTRVPWNGVFDNGQPMPPAHPNCRCTAVLIPPTRGLTGVPSQRSPESWIRELEALEAEQIAELEAERVGKMLKHRQGKHDQRSHGSWAKGGRSSAIEQRLTQTATNDLMAAANYSLDQGIDAMRKHRYVGVEDAVNNGHWPPEKHAEKYRMGTTKFQNQSAIVYDPDGAEGVRLSSAEGQKAAREHAVDVMMNVWSVTSNEHSMILAMQDSVESEFDLENAALVFSATNPRLYSRLPEAKTHERVYRDVVRAQYEVTQKALADAGTKHVTVYRGTKAMEISGIDTTDIQLRPASSWTTNIEVANRFASGTYGDPDGVVMKMTVPASKVLSTPDTGWGMESESELVILGGEYRAEVAALDYVSWFSKYGELNGLRIRRSS